MTDRHDDAPPPLGVDELEAMAPTKPRRDHGEANRHGASLAGLLVPRLTSVSLEELEAAREPWPHAWSDGEAGLFPVGEVSVLAAPGREGKTYATVALAGSFVLGTRLAGLDPLADRTCVFYSSEDDRAQYARKIGAWCWRLGEADRERARRRLIVPDLADEAMQPFVTLVGVVDRAPVETLAAKAIIEAVEAAELEAPPGLIFFETASTLSEAEEDNRALRSLIRALRRVARGLRAAVVLVHHTSQAASGRMADLALSFADIRGGTALAFNSRQNAILVNLGSAAEPHPAEDARAVLRDMVAPAADGRITVLATIDSSKSADPPIIALQWHATPFGPALALQSIPRALQDASWRRVAAMLRGERVGRRDAARTEARAATVERVVEIVGRLSREGRQATARAVSVAAGRSQTWAAPYLAAAVEAGELTASEEAVPRTRGRTVVYRLAGHSTEARQ